MSDFGELVRDVAAFSDERGWRELQSPKNLAMAICGEAGELAAELQWLTTGQSEELMVSDEGLRERVAMEMADVVIYLARLADVTGIDLMAAAREKLARNRERFPVGTQLRLREGRS